MNTEDTTLIMEHINENTELKSLWDEHQEFENQLEKMNRKPFLNPQEKIERKRLQLAKLAGKTKIETILNEYRNGAVTA